MVGIGTKACRGVSPGAIFLKAPVLQDDSPRKRQQQCNGHLAGGICVMMKVKKTNVSQCRLGQEVPSCALVEPGKDHDHCGDVAVNRDVMKQGIRHQVRRNTDNNNLFCACGVRVTGADGDGDTGCRLHRLPKQPRELRALGLHALANVQPNNSFLLRPTRSCNPR